MTLDCHIASVCAPAWFCPILYNAIDQYKQLVGYRPRRFCHVGRRRKSARCCGQIQVRFRRFGDQARADARVTSFQTRKRLLRRCR
jgi:hypothetical protein